MNEQEQINRIAQLWAKVRPLKQRSSKSYTPEDTNNAHLLARAFNEYIGRRALKECTCAIPHNLRITGNLLVKAGLITHWNDTELKQITYEI